MTNRHFSMKSFKIITAALAISVLILSGCQKDAEPGVDSSKPVPKDLTFDETNSSATTLAVYWDAREALAAGATSFTIQIPTTLTGGDNYNSKVSQTLSSSSTCDAATFSGLTTGSAYFIRVRANYPNSVYSDWVYYQQNNEPVLYVLGYGFIAQGTFPVPVISTVTPTADKITAKWASVYGADGYTLEYKKTAETTWTPINVGNVTTYDIEGLSDLTSYDLRLQGYASSTGKTSEYSAVVTTTTLKKAAFPMTIATADQLVAALTGTELSTGDATSVINITADIDMTGKSFASIATFVGTVNGNNHSIKNWKSTTPMFQSVANVNNLTFDSSCAFTVSAGQFGALAATSTGKISNVTNKAPVTYSLTSDATESIILGGIVGVAEGDMDKCTNSGAVTLTGTGSLQSTLVGGVVGYENGAISNCSNTGAVTLSATTLSAVSTIKDLAKVPIMTAGVAAATRSTVSSCNNSGKLSYTLSNMDGFALTSIGRVNIGGVVAAPNGNLTSCDNSGAIDIKCYTSSRTAYAANNYILCIGGVSGGDAYGTDQNTTNMTSCTNEGNMTIDMDPTKSNSAIGGIVGWPGVEGATQTILVKDCTNKGNISLIGAGKARTGGIAGGAGNISGCKNYGEVKINSSCANCTAGGIEGFASQNLVFTDNSNFGNVINSATAVAAYVGGLIANYGNVKSTPGAGCVVKCTVSTGGDATYAGMVIGYYNGTSNPTVFATAENPVKVSGTFISSAGTVTLTSSNYATYLKGTQANGGVQTINSVFGE